MNLRDRLRLMRPAASTRPGPAAPGQPPAAPPEAGGSSAPAGPPTAQTQPVPGSPPTAGAGATPAEATLPGSAITGRLIPTGAGPAFCIDHHYPSSQRRGRLRLDAVAQVPPQGWERIGRHPAWAAFDPTRAVYFDTETTGLERGTGTVIFLAGVGRFVDGQFRLRQFFLRDYPEEAAFLTALLDEMAGASAVVTFNGKSFDWPLLATRTVLHRMRLPELPHLDLLFPARRLWRETAASCRLIELEAAILGSPRDGDVPSHLIPQLYFAYLRSGSASALAGVLEHNRLDILSLVALAGYLGQAAAQPLTAAPAGTLLSAPELLALGRLLLERGEQSSGIAALEAALERGIDGPARGQAQRLLAAAYKRLDQYDQALQIWETMTREGGYGYGAFIELAKYYEHRARDYARARAAAQAALERLHRQRLLSGAGRNASPRWQRELQELQHRLTRLEAKLAKAAARGRGQLGADQEGGSTQALPR